MIICCDLIISWVVLLMLQGSFQPQRKWGVEIFPIKFRTVVYFCMPLDRKLYISAGGSHFSLVRVDFNFCTNVFLAIGELFWMVPGRTILVLFQRFYDLDSSQGRLIFHSLWYDYLYIIHQFPIKGNHYHLWFSYSRTFICPRAEIPRCDPTFSQHRVRKVAQDQRQTAT